MLRIGLLISILFHVGNSWSQDVFECARSGNIEVIESLWAHNNDTINAHDNNGFSPLILATYRSQVKVVEFLISKKVEVDYNSQEGTALLGACYKGNLEIAKLLISAGIDVDTIGGRGASALIYAVQSRNTELVQLLIDNNADTKVKDASNRTAYDYAKKMSLKEIQLLLK